MRGDLIEHTIAPVYNSQSRILILGTMPSPKSREAGFYYSHPKNRFWTVLAELLKKPLPISNDEKTKLLLEHKIALWDVLKSCEIKGADDGSIKNPLPNDMTSIIKSSNITAVFTTGKKATELYKRFIIQDIDIEPYYLPSTSPANCAVKLSELLKRYAVILDYL